MYLRQIRAFVAVAEELHFSRAAKRLHIEQSPLSRTIRNLEAYLDVRLLYRSSHSVTLTPAGKVFLEDCRRILLACEQAQIRTRAVAAGYRGTLRIALSPDVRSTRLAALLALCRQEEPALRLQLTELPVNQLIQALSADLFDAGLAMDNKLGDEIAATPLWRDPLLVVVSARHPLLALKAVPLKDVLSYPLVLCDPQVCDGCHQLRELLFQSGVAPPLVIEQTNSHSIMLALVAAGYGVGIVTRAHLEGCSNAEVLTRPLSDLNASMTTYLLHHGRELIEPVREFIDRARRVDTTQ